MVVRLVFTAHYFNTNGGGVKMNVNAETGTLARGSVFCFHRMKNLFVFFGGNKSRKAAVGCVTKLSRVHFNSFVNLVKHLQG